MAVRPIEPERSQKSEAKTRNENDHVTNQLIINISLNPIASNNYHGQRDFEETEMVSIGIQSSIDQWVHQQTWIRYILV